MNFTIKDLVKGNFCEFSYYRKGFAYYTIAFEENKYIFPVELITVGDGNLNKIDKALTLMKWIREAISNNTFIRVLE